VREIANEGIDTVQSLITYTLGSNVENLTLTGSSNINGTGNTLNNSITGNSGNNTLTGNAGNDFLDGGAGSDALNGGTGNDTYVFTVGYGTDTITENDTTAGNTDTVQMGVNPIDVVFARTGNNLDMTLHGTSDKLTVQSWYSGSAYQTEVITAVDGSQLLNSQVSQLIQAMATFCSSNGLANWDQAVTQRPQDVQTILAQYWTP
jgi:Ca2+-binding RTX toxin-like protein